jgi:hypothetical protein
MFRSSSLLPDSPQDQIPMGFKIFIGCFLTPFVAIGIGLILLILGVFPEFDVPIAFLIPFAIVWNGIIGLMIYLIFIKKLNFQGQMVRLQKRVAASSSSLSSSVKGQWSLSSKGNLDSFPEQPESVYSSGYSSDSREEDYSSSMPPPPTIPKSNFRIGRFLALVMPLGIIVYLVVFQIFPMIEEAGGIEQAYAIHGTFLLLMVGAVFGVFVGMLRSLRAMQRRSENSSSF